MLSENKIETEIKIFIFINIYENFYYSIFLNMKIFTKKNDKRTKNPGISFHPDNPYAFHNPT